MKHEKIKNLSEKDRRNLIASRFAKFQNSIYNL